ncbi:MAG: RNase adapter RapZ [Oscillospiraceae bacterium]|nr:RNase adapter RapZ [Oscillospiraceae bacterium]
MEFVIVSGLSGAGKSKAVEFMEDMGFFCVDNLPAPLIPKFAELCMAGHGEYERVALVTDIRGGGNFDGLFQALDALNAMNCDYKILFVEANEETIIKRYKETRRNHPLSHEGSSLQEAVAAEREMLAPVRARAAYIIDTSTLSTAKLRGEVLRLFGRESDEKAVSINVLSFGFKYGLPIEADLVLDVRFLPNPFYVPELRNKTGISDDVYHYVMDTASAKEFMQRLEKLFEFLLPQYVEEGKSALVIAVGCTGGKHRSVSVTRALAAYIRQKGYSVSENHRDMTRA